MGIRFSPVFPIRLPRPSISANPCSCIIQIATFQWSANPSMTSHRHRPATAAKSDKGDRDFLNHLEAYLAKRDRVDKLLKISRYASKIILASPALTDHHPLRLGKFIQDVNDPRSTPYSSDCNRLPILLHVVVYDGEGIYYFVEQFIWLAKSGLIDPKHSRKLQKISAWMELVGYVGSIGLKIRDLRKLNEEKACFDSSKEISSAKGLDSKDDRDRERALSFKISMKRLSIVQDLADWLMTLSDV